MCKFEEYMDELGAIINKIKIAYAEDTGVNPNYLLINIDEDNYIYITSTKESGFGNYYDYWKGWIG